MMTRVLGFQTLAKSNGVQQHLVLKSVQAPALFIL